MATMNVSETLLTEVDVSRQLRISLGTVRRWRLLRCGPGFSEDRGLSALPA